ncbi:MAG TPA: endolytic transglycosylase MltG [Bacillota bacterium]|nr:endolytic transglycosylase MltG [Bacillota bacterium]
MTDVTTKDKKATKAQNKTGKKILRQFLIYAISLTIVVSTVAIAITVAYNRYIKPVDIEDNTLIEVEVPMGSSINDIADILYESDLIRSTSVFKLMVDFSNKSNRMQAGKYELSKSMTIEKMIDELLTGRVTVTTVSVTIREGDDIRKIASRLSNDYNLGFTEEEFIKEIKSTHKYIRDYPILGNIPVERLEGEFPLEGYLSPDTYYVFADSTPEQLIRKLLAEFENKFDNEIREKAEELDMSIDEVVTLASVIQNEGTNEDFEKVSAVFHNRINIDMRLESCATVNYVIEKEVNQTNITVEDTKIESPYNTYRNNGLPIGPISSPGKAAILAALNPYQEYMTEDNRMLFFVLMDPQEGLHSFNTTYQGHVNDKNKYEELWYQ